MIVFGLDPGYHRVGWGVVETTGQKVAAKEWGCVETDTKSDLPERLLQIYEEIKKVLKKQQKKTAQILTASTCLDCPLLARDSTTKQ